MTTKSTLLRGVAALGIAATSFLVLAPGAMADDPPKPSASCKIPSLSAIPDSVTPGSTVTVAGQNFSGCPADGDATPPTPVLEVKIGIATDQKMGQVLATTQTAADGTFTVSVTIPAVASAGDKLALAAGSADAATKLVYAAVVPLQYSGGTTVPTGVPAGTGGLAATLDPAANNLLNVAGGAGVLLAGVGAVGLRRRATSRI